MKLQPEPDINFWKFPPCVELQGDVTSFHGAKPGCRMILLITWEVRSNVICSSWRFKGSFLQLFHEANNIDMDVSAC